MIGAPLQGKTQKMDMKRRKKTKINTEVKKIRKKLASAVVQWENPVYVQLESPRETMPAQQT